MDVIIGCKLVIAEAKPLVIYYRQDGLSDPVHPNHNIHTMPQDHKPRKNPFEVRELTTVKRSVEEAYPERKGLNKPQFIGNTKLDQLFQRLEDQLSEGLESVTVDSLYKKLFNNEAPVDARYKVVNKLLDYLSLVQENSIENYEQHKEKNLISISLHDIKTFGKLVNLIIILGIYPCLTPFKIGIPFEKRRLNDFGKPIHKAIKIAPVLPRKDSSTYTDRFAEHQELLVLIYKKLGHVLFTKSDVLALLMKGSGYSDFLTIAIALCTVPYFDSTVRTWALGDFDNVVLIANTFELYQDYTLLVQSPSPIFFKQFVMDKLQVLPYSAPRGDGLLTLIEFVLGLRDQEEISVEKFDHVTRVVLLKPKSASSVDYFRSIGRQCYDLLVNINRPTICTCVVHVMEQLWMKNQKIVQDFILEQIWSKFLPDTQGEQEFILVSEAELNNNINVLLSITKRCQLPTLLKATFMPVLVSLWSYYVFVKGHDKSGDVVQNIIVSYLTLLGEDYDTVYESIDIIARNLVSTGGDGWKYRLGPNGLIEICREEKSSFANEAPEKKVLDFMKLLDSGCTLYIDILKQIDNESILRLFEALLKRWLRQDQQPLNEMNSFIGLVDLRLLESIAKEFNDKLAQSPLRILKIVSSVLDVNRAAVTKRESPVKTEDSDDEDSDNEDSETPEEITNVVLEILSSILSECEASDLDVDCRNELEHVNEILLRKLQQSPAAGALRSRIATILKGEAPPKDETDAQKKLFERAIASLNDPLVPIRAHGLFLLRQLVEQRSLVVSVDFAVNLHLLQLKDPEPFIYLNVIKGLESLLDWDPTECVPLLVSLYAGHNETQSLELDERLRVGEALLRYIQLQHEAFSGESAKTISDGALQMIRVREKDQDNVDDKLRMSAMSLLGTCCNENPIGIYENLENALDCAIGILQLETAKDKAIMRRSAIVLIHDLIVGTSTSDAVPFPKSYMSKVLTTLGYIQTSDTDLLTREQATSVLETIDDFRSYPVDQSD